MIVNKMVCDYKSLSFVVDVALYRHHIKMRPRGGVATQRIANPSTSVRFRARPPNSHFLWLFPLLLKPSFTANLGCFRFSHVPSLTAIFRRQRRTAGMSMDRIINPNGIIQKPRMGRKPNIPAIINSPPMIILANLLAGSLYVRPAIFIFDMRE